MTEEKVQIVLTDEEWMSIINKERDGLPPCCANVSNLRDEIISIARADGASFYTYHDHLKIKLGWVFPEHGEPSPAIQKIIGQIGWTPPEDAQHHADKHADF
jgi:hypothetical protein